MAMLNYRTPTELNDRFERSWQSDLDPLGGGGRFAVESYLDFHGNKFTRRFDANSYIVLTEAMNSHDIGRGRGGVGGRPRRRSGRRASCSASTATGTSPLDGQRGDRRRPRRTACTGERPVLVHSEYGHDAFLIEHAVVGDALRALLAA